MDCLAFAPAYNIKKSDRIMIDQHICEVILIEKSKTKYGSVNYHFVTKEATTNRKRDYICPSAHMIVKITKT